MNTYILNDANPAITELHISGNKNNGVILIDTADVEKVRQHKWYIKDRCKDNQHNYVAGRINNRTVKLHRFLLDITDRKIIVDHIDRDVFNNTRKNLRGVTYVENNHNTIKRCTNTSGKTGVYLYKRGTDKNGVKRSNAWVASVKYNGKETTKRFSVDKYGNDAAFEAAVKWRAAKALELGILTGQS